jgi:putative aldouronate transport system substrate-binding protein
MKRKVKKTTAFILTLVLALSVMLTGCSKDKETETNADADQSTDSRYTVDGNTPAWKLDTKENTKLTWYVNADWWNTDWGNDTVTKKIKEDLKIDVEFITGDDTKLNTMFAGDDLPDIITIFDSNSSVAKTADQWALSLNDLADKYDPYFYKVAKQDTLDWYKMADGKTYGYPDYSNSQEDYDNGSVKAATAFVIRKDIYEALGKPGMGTPEEFLSVLKQIKEKYPDLIPFGFNDMTTSVGSLGPDFQNFIGVPIENQDGTWYDRNMDIDYLTWLKTFNHAYTQGLISDDRFADDNTAYEEKIKSGQYATIMIGGTPQRSGALQVWMSSNPDSAYIAIDGPQSTVGNAPTLSQSGLSGWAINYITKDCTDTTKAIELFTYLLSDDAGILTSYGVEGETYKVNDAGKYELLPEVKDMKTNDNDKFKKQYRLGEFCLFGHDRYQAQGADQMESVQQMKDWGEGKLKPQFIIENIDPDQGTAEARSLSAITTNWNTTLVSMIRATDDTAFDQLLSDHKKFRDENNWESIVKVRNEKMATNKEKLGIK